MRAGKNQRGRTPSGPFPFPNLFSGLRYRLLCLLGGARFLVLPLELVDAAGGVHQLLLTGEERVAGRADFHADIAFMRRARLEGMAAGADHIQFVVSGVNSDLHFITGIPFETLSIPPKKTNPP